MAALRYWGAGFAIVAGIAVYHDAIHTNGMHWFVFFLMIPFFVAFLCGRSSRFQLLGAFCMVASLLNGNFTTAGILWLSLLVLPFLLPNSPSRRR